MKPTRLLSGTFTKMLGAYAKLNLFFSLLLKANSPKANRASRLRIARSVAAFVSLFMAISISNADSSAIQLSNKEIITSLANYQLTDKQYQCHQEIIYRESRWDDKAIGNIDGTKQAYGLYQLKIRSMRTASPVLQFWKYWDYVVHRYGITEYDEPNYCGALSHLKSKGWQ